MAEIPSNLNVGAPNAPYFTPIQDPPAGTAFDPQPDGRPVPKIFQPLRIRGVVFPNRIWLSPLCQYSALDGMMTPWHMAHLGGIFTRGPGHAMIEATAVTANGRISPEDVGIWSDAHIEPLAQVVAFAHSQSQLIGIQLAHAGRKASTIPPFLSGHQTATEAARGWPDDVWAPSAIRFQDDFPQPKELSTEDVHTLVQAFVDAARRAVQAGFDVIEIHGAHGYLIQEFLSPLSNKRTDEYGGSFENRVRFALEIADGIRAVIPESMPLFFRISGTDWVEETLPDEPSWRVEDTARIAPLLYAHGVDLIDISSGGNSSKQKIGPTEIKIPAGAEGAYQAPFARAVMEALGANEAFPSAKELGTAQYSPQIPGRPARLLVSTVGKITSGPQAETLLQDGFADVVHVGRQFLKDPFTVWTFAEQLGDVKIQLPSQIRWGFTGRGTRPSASGAELKRKREGDEESGDGKRR